MPITAASSPTHGDDAPSGPAPRFAVIVNGLLQDFVWSSRDKAEQEAAHLLETASSSVIEVVELSAVKAASTMTINDAIPGFDFGPYGFDSYALGTYVDLDGRRCTVAVAQDLLDGRPDGLAYVSIVERFDLSAAEARSLASLLLFAVIAAEAEDVAAEAARMRAEIALAGK